MKTAVVGGGISGLVVAYELKKAGVEVSLYEKEAHVGSSIKTSALGPLAVVEEGADAFLARAASGVEFCRELGIELISPAASGVLIANRGKLKPLKQPQILGVPLNPGTDSALKADFERTEIQEPELTKETVGSLVRRRIGDEIYEDQVAPLIGAISASNPDDLSLETASPLLAKASQASPSLIKGIMLAAGINSDSASGSGSAGAAAFYAPAGGMSEIPRRLVRELGDVAKFKTKIKSLDEIEADRFVLAVPAYVSAELLKGKTRGSPEGLKTTTQSLAEVEYASVCVAQLIYKRSEIPKEWADLSGVLFPEKTSRITAVSFASQKWPQHFTSLLSENLALIRVSAGRYGDDEILTKSDQEILELVQKELSEHLSIDVEPEWSRVSRWEKTFPQYFLGHKEKMQIVQNELEKRDIYLAGAVLDGVGIPACIESGIFAAQKIIQK